MESVSLQELREADPSLQSVSPEAFTEGFKGICTLSTPKANTLGFVSDRKFYKQLLEGKNDYSKCGIIVSQKLWEELTDNDRDHLKKITLTLLTSKDVLQAMCAISKIFYDRKYLPINNFIDGRQMGSAKVHPTAMIAQGCFIGENVVIEENVCLLPGATVLGHCTIGAGTIVFPQTVIYPFTTIGKNCRIHSCSVIGGDGFGYHFRSGEHKKIWHIGGVIIGDNVEIGANTSIDQGTFDPTVIGNGCKIDNQVQVGHNSILDDGVILCGQVGLSGSCKIGPYSVLGGKAGVGPGVELGKGMQIAGSAMVTGGRWDDGTELAGHPARPVKEWMKGVAYLRKESLKKEK